MGRLLPTLPPARYWGTPPGTVPDNQRALLTRIRGRAGFPVSCWDVFCWPGDDVLFVESKRKGKDRIPVWQIETVTSEEAVVSLEMLLRYYQGGGVQERREKGRFQLVKMKGEWLLAE